MLPKFARAAAYVLAILLLVGPFTGHPGSILPAVVFAAGGWGIGRRRVWSAYGLALYLVAELLYLPVGWARGIFSTPHAPFLAAGSILHLGLAVLFFFTGRALSVAGSPRGRAAPWLAVAAFTVALAGGFVFYQPFRNPTASMEDSLMAGDFVLVRSLPQITVQGGDLVAFHYPPDRRQVFLKRVVGMPGDRIRMVDKRLYINGSPAEEPYATHRTSYMDPFRDNFPGAPPSAGLVSNGIDMLAHHLHNGEIVVPEGNYFVLGDNRDFSLDSRYWGFVPAADIIGRPVVIYWSKQLPEAGGAIRWNRILKTIPRPSL